MDPTLLTQYVLLGAVIAGITEFISRVRATDYWVAATVACAAITGLLFGLGGVEGLTPVSGLAAGFGVSGALSGIGMFKGKSTPAPSKVIGPRKK